MGKELSEMPLARTIYQDNDYLLEEDGGRYSLQMDGKTYRLETSIKEPILYIKGPDRVLLTIHHAFTMDELVYAIHTNGKIRIISGNDHDIRGILGLVRKAVEVGKDGVDLSYIESCLFYDYLKEKGAVSPETARSSSEIGLENCAMYSFMHSNRVDRTSDNRYYLKSKKGKPDPGTTDHYSRVISTQVRFGYGYRTVDGRKQFFAWHGVPGRNDDFFTTAEITSEEYREIEREYPGEIIADRETAERFNEKYVKDHPVLLQAWNRTL